MTSFIFIILLLLSSASQALVPEFKTYLRAGTGGNAKGAGQECLVNKGSSGNEFRLGNECGIYGEFSLGAMVLKPESPSGPFWRLHSNFAFVYENRTDWENNNPNSWVLRELYTEAGRVDGMNFNAWAGKRFYRWGDLHMNDFYAIDMSGPGGGFGDIKTEFGNWSVALIQNTSADVTTIGHAAKTTLHIRLDESVNALGTWSYWLVGGTTPSTKDIAALTDYKSATGAFLAIKNQTPVFGGGNELGIAAGQSIMSNLGSQGDAVKDCLDESQAECTRAKSKRIRIWDGFTFESPAWSTQTALIYEEYDKGTSADSKVRWSSFGIRPMYWFTDHLSLAFQAGISNIVDESDGLGSRNLMRFTIAPQLSFGKGFYSRPALRFFYSKTQWSENNKISAASSSFAEITDMDSFGFQTEVWF